MSALLKPVEPQDSVVAVAVTKTPVPVAGAVIAHPLRASTLAAKRRQTLRRHRRMAALTSAPAVDLMLLR